jgi:hypothetical protein
MARKITVALEDDLTGGPADETVRFSFEGTDYGRRQLRAFPHSAAGNYALSQALT